MEPAISLHGITKVFTDVPGTRTLALQDISCTIGAGEFFVILGPSGSGKSTLLRIMSGLEKSYQGTSTFGSTYSHADIGFVFQQFALMPWMTVFENVELGLLSKGMTPAARHAIVMRELKQLGLEKFAYAHSRELSGGMRQRVGLARALAVEPKIMFMDEPFSSLDSFTAEELRRELLVIWEQRKITIVMVTHLIEEAIQLADRIAVLTPRPGKLEKIITNTIPRPRVNRSPIFWHLEDEIRQLIRF